ncbi:MAG: tRNA synthetase valyl/leucyl anticodon-binding [Candidatus Parvarchaeum acidophilus ARMAN-5]|jgi:leucyl-tRNA synthetase|uniref:Leucine--tRNA ligase n=1 Tax=Candidatus Parvarchaeum acidophilus ARMAN-5 TaxID=662762 RepID=D6GU94_PARA5|nr:MAG: tRNA synthetase valyl/leucyl anticodon-binding [Candidatus Parvarchaeum acidophilus ARMAN-5]
MPRYEPEKIEEKWRKIYKEKNLYDADIDENKEKFFITVPVMYPDGRLHTGHMYTWTRADVFARFQRMKGKKVLFPQGFHMTGGPMAGMSLRLRNGDQKAIEIMRKQGAKDDDIKRFAESPLELGLFFGNTYKNDFNLAGTSIDWRRNFILSYTKQYSKFVEWQFRTLRKLGYITQGSHPVVWCPREDTSLSDHDRAEGEGEGPLEFTIIKFDIDGLILPAATLRPETIYGVSNIWINKDGEYKKIKFSGGEQWIVSKEFTEKVQYQSRKAEIIEDFDISELIGKKATNPINGEEIPVLDGEFVKTDINTGIVMSVPMHAPLDYYYYNKKKEEYKLKEARKVIDVNDRDTLVADAIKKYGSDEKGLEEATKYVYKTEFNYGVLNKENGALSGKPAKDAKEAAIELIKSKHAYDIFYETSAKIICRCGARGIIKLVENQWFIRYSDKELKEKTLDWIQKMNIKPEEAKAQIMNAVYNMEDKAATRHGGLGTPLPWDSSWLIEPLSDSTIYMAYYTFSHIIKDMKEEDITDDMFDYVLLGKGDNHKFDDRVESMKKEFEYWYPLDLRVTAKELITNHIAFFIMTHVAMFSKDKWPRGVGINGWLTVNKQKMSKSKGNSMTIESIVKEYGADAARLIASASNGMDDAEWDTNNNINGFKQKIEFVLELTEIIESFSDQRKLADEFLLSKINRLIRNAEREYDYMKYKNSINYSFFEFIDRIKQYLNYGGNNKETIRYALTVFAKLNHPMFPFVTEEINSAINGGEILESYASWPETRQENENDIVESEFEVLSQTINDINNLLRITKKKPEEIIIGIADKEKFDIYNLVREKAELTRNIGELRKGLPSNEFVNKLLKNPKRLPDKKLDAEKELKVFKEMEEKLKEMYNCKIKIEESKEDKAIPGRPMITIK